MQISCRMTDALLTPSITLSPQFCFMHSQAALTCSAGAMGDVSMLGSMNCRV
jgi:hypothetical protein